MVPAAASIASVDRFTPSSTSLRPSSSPEIVLSAALTLSSVETDSARPLICTPASSDSASSSAATAGRSAVRSFAVCRALLTPPT